MAEPSNQSAILRIANFFRLSGINRTVPESIWSNFPSLSLSDRPLITDQARRIVTTSQQIEGAANGANASNAITLYPDSDSVTWRVKVRFTDRDGNTQYRMLRDHASSAGGVQGIVDSISSIIDDMANRYGWQNYQIYFDTLIVWGE